MTFGLGRNFKCSKSRLITVNKKLSDPGALEGLKIMPQPENGPSTLGKSVDKCCLLDFWFRAQF